MKIKHWVLGLLVGAALGFGTACSDDDEDVRRDTGSVRLDGGRRDTGVRRDTSVARDSAAARDTSVARDSAAAGDGS